MDHLISVLGMIAIGLAILVLLVVFVAILDLLMQDEANLQYQGDLENATKDLIEKYFNTINHEFEYENASIGSDSIEAQRVKEHLEDLLKAYKDLIK